MSMPDLNSLLGSLSDEDISALGDMAQQLFGSAPEQSEPEQSGNPFGSIDPAVLAKIMHIMPLLQSGTDNDRTRLICALKPLLSKPRRQKADEALQLIRLLEILPLIGSDMFGQ